MVDKITYLPGLGKFSDHVALCFNFTCFTEKKQQNFWNMQEVHVYQGWLHLMYKSFECYRLVFHAGFKFNGTMEIL